MTPYQHKLQTAEDSSRSSDAPQRICIMDLPALRAIPFLHRNQSNSLACGRVHVGTGLNSPARTSCWYVAILAGLRPSWVVYGQPDGLRRRGSSCEQSDVGTGRTTGQTDNGTDKVETQSPAAGYAAYDLRKHKIFGR